MSELTEEQKKIIENLNNKNQYRCIMCQHNHIKGRGIKTDWFNEHLIYAKENQWLSGSYDKKGNLVVNY
jgi:hypothetical protein